MCVCVPQMSAVFLVQKHKFVAIENFLLAKVKEDQICRAATKTGRVDARTFLGLLGLSRKTNLQSSTCALI